VRYRVVDFLPLLLAIGLLGAWLAFQQPFPVTLPWAVNQTAPPPNQQAPRPTPPPPTLVPRAVALQSLCDTNRPRFLGTLANLKARLGSRMGEATECERPIDDDGNTQQMTTTGLAYYRHRLDVAVFTNGYDHWGLDDDRMLHWIGEAVEPPADAAVDTSSAR